MASEYQHQYIKPFIRDPHAHPEIFETPDPPSPRSSSDDLNDESDDDENLLESQKCIPISTSDELVQTVSCSVKRATSQFEQSGVDNSTTDFTMLHGNEMNRMYQTYHRLEYQQLVKDMRKFTKETPYQRYLRLKSELHDLEIELSSPQSTKQPQEESIRENDKKSHPEHCPMGATTSSPLSILDNLSQLQTKLQTLDTHFQSQTTNISLQPLKHHLEALQQIPPSSTSPHLSSSTSSCSSVSPPSTLTYEIHYTSLPNTPSVSEFEQRISRLEKALGQPSLHSPCMPLIPFLSHLEHKLHKLHENSSTMISQTTSSTSSTSLLSSLKEDKKILDQVDVCYQLLKQLEPMLPLIPMILDRLLSLQMLHMEASETLMGIQRWMQLMATLQSETHCLKQQYDALAESIQVNKSQMEQNTVVILEKIQALEKNFLEKQ